ncbi:hypothetical protein [Aquamicrobium sp. LC103]|uniref:hypothetical protein n=1 Tax=Aquamicrobium sp. LC103 TaxID=1120658 RepID=UPI0014858C34|nr:hypothetical protein [Aquamicrobium sp. LC103]
MPFRPVFAVLSAPRDRTRLPDGAPEHFGERHMLDIIMLAIGFGFFALTVLYGTACERL